MQDAQSEDAAHHLGVGRGSVRSYEIARADVERDDAPAATRIERHGLGRRVPRAAEARRIRVAEGEPHAQWGRAQVVEKHRDPRDAGGEIIAAPLRLVERDQAAAGAHTVGVDLEKRIAQPERARCREHSALPELERAQVVGLAEHHGLDRKCEQDRQQREERLPHGCTPPEAGTKKTEPGSLVPHEAPRHGRA